jgi:hypothetical protein
MPPIVEEEEEPMITIKKDKEKTVPSEEVKTVPDEKDPKKKIKDKPKDAKYYKEVKLFNKVEEAHLIGYVKPVPT